MPFRTLSPAAHGSACDAAPAAPSLAAPMRALDSLRGLAALAVVFTHLLSMGPELGPELERLLGATPLRAVHTGRAPVVFFFVLSGYVLALSLLRPDAPGPFGFALRRALRLMPPVVAAVLLSAGLRALFYAGPLPVELGWDARLLWSEPVEASTLLRQALLLGADHRFTLDIPLWSLVHEWRLSLAFPLVLLFRRRPALLLAAALALHAAAIGAGAAPDVVQLGPRLPFDGGGERLFRAALRRRGVARLRRPAASPCGGRRGRSPGPAWPWRRRRHRTSASSPPPRR